MSSSLQRWLQLNRLDARHRWPRLELVPTGPAVLADDVANVAGAGIDHLGTW